MSLPRRHAASAKARAATSEPTGALAAAAALEGSVPVAGRRVGVILSGGNVDVSQVSTWIAQQ